MMSREIDRRTFTRGKLTPERTGALLGLAEKDSDNLPADHRVSITEFDTTTGNPAAVLSEAAPAEKGNYVQRALDHVQRGISTTLGLEDTQPAEFVADPSVQEASSGAVAVHLQQMYKGIPIFQASQAVRFDPQGRLRDTIGQSITIPQELAVEPKLRVQDAVLAAAQQVAAPDPDELHETDQFGEPLRPLSVDLKGFTPQIIATFPNKPDQPTVLAAGPFGDEIKANLIWFDLDGDLRLAWEVILTLPDYASQYRTMVDAQDGTMLYCHQLIHHVAARGNVYRLDGGEQREMLDFPLALDTYGVSVLSGLPNGFPDAWVDANLAEGNCVLAHLDDDGPTIAGMQEGDVVVFNPADDKGNAQRILNIFYLNCYIHNYFYLLGFRERDGNFQRNNFGRGGSPSDPVDARVYNGPIDKTASMFTPIDGTSPIMRMGLVTSTNNHTALDSSVIFHEFTHGVTNRLVGGQLNGHALDAIQSQSMGEGWSDYIACTINKSMVVAAWVVGKPGGIRNFPYDSNYPHHFGDLGTGLYVEPRIHNIGEIWCAALLEMNRNIGANLGVQLVFDALRLTPANPSFLKARDAILRSLDFMREANHVDAGQYTAARSGIWRAFAKFGMGAAARCDDARTLTGIVADFRLPDQPDQPAVPAPSSDVDAESTPNQPIVDNDASGVTSVLPATQGDRHGAGLAALQDSVDDMQRIAGIGPGIERRLHNAGILTYAQLAALSPDEIIERLGLSGVAAKNVVKQDWIGQARDLAPRPAPGEQPDAAGLVARDDEMALGVGQPDEAGLVAPNVEEASESRQHYATFTVELLLGEESEVRRTRVKHIQEGEQETWAGWEDGRLVSFFVEHAALRQAAGRPSMPGLAAPGAEGEGLLSDLYIEVADLDVSTVPASPADGDRLRADIEFHLSGLAAKQVAAERAAYFIHILAYMPVTGETIVLTAIQGQLQPDTLTYTKTVEFAPAEVGHYQLLATVVLSEYNAVGAVVGPKLRVI